MDSLTFLSSSTSLTVCMDKMWVSSVFFTADTNLCLFSHEVYLYSANKNFFSSAKSPIFWTDMRLTNDLACAVSNEINNFALLYLGTSYISKNFSTVSKNEEAPRFQWAFLCKTCRIESPYFLVRYAKCASSTCFCRLWPYRFLEASTSPD